MEAQGTVSSVINRRRRKHRLGILVVGDESVASTRYRVLAHLSALDTAGYDASVAFQPSRPARRLFRMPLRVLDELRDLRRFSDCDLLMIHRRSYPPIMAGLLGGGRRPTVFDFDDALYLPSPTETHSIRDQKRYRSNFNATTAAVDLVLCGNTELAREVEHQRTSIVPTAVDCSRFHPEVVGPTLEPHLGWVGHSSNLSFLEGIAGPLRELASRHSDLKLIVVADREPNLEGVPMEFRRWSLDRELECFRDIGIGLMPLDDTPWTRAKCAFKLLQYMALGVPAVVSPVGMNKEVVVSGENAFLATTDDDWVARLDELIGSPELRRRLGRAGRETVVERFSLPVVSRRLITCLDQVMVNRQSLPKLS